MLNAITGIKEILPISISSAFIFRAPHARGCRVDLFALPLSAHAVARLPDTPAEATETASGTAIGAHADEGITLLGCLQRIRHAVLAFMSATADTAVRRYQ